MWGTITPQGSNNYAGIHEFRKGRDGVMASDAGNLRKFRKYDSDDAFAKDYVGLMERLIQVRRVLRILAHLPNALQMVRAVADGQSHNIHSRFKHCVQ